MALRAEASPPRPPLPGLLLLGPEVAAGLVLVPRKSRVCPPMAR